MCALEGRGTALAVSGEKETKTKKTNREINITWSLKSAILLVDLMTSIELTHFITHFSAATHNINPRFSYYNQPLTEFSSLEFLTRFLKKSLQLTLLVQLQPIYG